jgi:hypothetical protein
MAFVVIAHRHHPGLIDTQGPVQVLVATKAIQKGTSGDVIRSDPALYSIVGLDPSQVHSGAILDPAALAGKVAVTNIARGQQITAADFDPSSAISAPSLDDRRAFIIPSPEELGGQIAVGDHADVLLAKSGKLRVLERNMQVLSVSTNGVALRATTRQAGRLIAAMQQGRLVLRR